MPPNSGILQKKFSNIVHTQHEKEYPYYTLLHPRCITQRCTDHNIPPSKDCGKNIAPRREAVIYPRAAFCLLPAFPEEKRETGKFRQLPYNKPQHVAVRHT